jgi:hypothetical protein
MVKAFFLFLLATSVIDLKVSAQEIPDGFFYDSLRCNYIYVENDTFYVYANGVQTWPVILYVLERQNKITLNSIPFDKKVDTQVSLRSPDDTIPVSKIYLHIEDYTGFEYSNTMNGIMYFSGASAYGEEKFITLEPTDGNYIFDFSDWSFNEAQLEITYLNENQYSWPNAEVPKIKIQKGESGFYDIVIAPKIFYPNLKKRIRFEFKDEVLSIFKYGQHFNDLYTGDAHFIRIEKQDVTNRFVWILEHLSIIDIKNPNNSDTFIE